MKRCMLIILAILIIVGTFIYGCGKPEPAESPAAEPQTIESGKTSEVVKAEENKSSTQVVKHSSGASIELAAGSLSSDAKIEIAEIESSNEANAPAYGTMYDIKVEGSKITKPALVSIPLPTQANPQEDWVLIHQVGGKWEYLPSVVSNGVVQAQTTSFSVFGTGKAKPAVLIDQAGKKQEIWLAYTEEAKKEYIVFKEYEDSEDIAWDDIEDGSKVYFADPDSEMVNWWEFSLDAVTHYGIPLEIFLKTVIKYEFKLLERMFEYIKDQYSYKTGEENWQDTATVNTDSGDIRLTLEIDQYRLLPSPNYPRVSDPKLIMTPALTNAEEVEDCELFYLVFHNGRHIAGYRQKVRNLVTQEVKIAQLWGEERTDPLQIIVVLVGKELGSSWFSFKKKQVLAVFSNLSSLEVKKPAPPTTPEPKPEPTPQPQKEPQCGWTYGGQKADNAYYIFETPDRGYLIIGNTESYGYGNEDVWLVKIDSYGNMDESHTRTIGTKNRDRVDAMSSFKKNVDGDGYYLYVSTYDNMGTRSYQKILIDNYGNEKSSTEIESQEYSARFRNTTEDGGWFDVSSSVYTKENHEEGSIRIDKYSVNGAPEWTEYFGEPPMYS